MSRPQANVRRWSRGKSIAVTIAGLAVVVTAIQRWRHHAYVSITPSTYSQCRGPDVVAHIKWDMRGTASGKTVFLSAYQVGMLPRVFGSGPLVGQVDTGEWVSDGTTLLFTDAKNRLLATRTIESTDCASAPLWTQPL
jgi:hypothetical protein